jgi:chromosome segregation ATPase
MERSTSVNPGPGEQNLTPGEQRILILLEQVQQGLEQRMERMEERLDQRMQSRLEDNQLRIQIQLDQSQHRIQSVEHKLSQQGEQLQTLMIKADYEGAASNMRDRQLTTDLQQLRKEHQKKELELLARQKDLAETLYNQANTLREDLSNRFNQLDTRLAMVEQAIQLSDERFHENSKSLQALTEEVRNLGARLGLKADASRVAALEQRLGEDDPPRPLLPPPTVRTT